MVIMKSDSSLFRAPCALLILLLAFVATQAKAVTPAVLIDPDLKPRLINLQAFAGSRVTYFDAERHLQIEPTGDILQIRFPLLKDDGSSGRTPTTADGKTDNSDKTDNAAKQAVIELIDGQRIAGTWQGADASGEVMLFKHAMLGDLKIKLDRVRSLSPTGVAVDGRTPTSDELLLVNGDVIKGFVVTLTTKEAEIQPDGSNDSIKLPIERIAAVRLANPTVAATKREHIIWMRDGSRIRCSKLSIESDRLALTSSLSGVDKQIDLKHVSRIELASLAGRLVDLADLPYKIAAGGSVFGLPTQPRKVGDQIHLHAPIKVQFELPPRTRRFAAIAELDLGKDTDARWADFLVNIRIDGNLAARVRIESKSPRLPINVKADGKTLEIELDPAANGPVLDRLRLREAMIFVESESN